MLRLTGDTLISVCRPSGGSSTRGPFLFFTYLFYYFYFTFSILSYYLQGFDARSSSSIRGEVSTIVVVKIGQSVKAERVKRFWTQERLAKEAGISQKALSKIETNEVEPRFSTILKLAEAFGVDPSELVNHE